MKLVDCFVELIAYVSYFIKSLPAEQPGYDRVRTDIVNLIQGSHPGGSETHINPEDFQSAQFAVFAWIDESILASAWQEKLQWQGDQLQRAFFKTVNAGELFFEKLNDLQPHQSDVREVYYLCLSMGFSGRYCNPGDDFLLAQLRSSNLRLLGNNIDSLSAYVELKLFPDGYHDDSTTELSSERKSFQLGTVLLAASPPLLMGLLYGIYRFSLNSVGENLIKSIQ